MAFSHVLGLGDNMATQSLTTCQCDALVLCLKAQGALDQQHDELQEENRDILLRLLDQLTLENRVQAEQIEQNRQRIAQLESEMRISSQTHQQTVLPLIRERDRREKELYGTLSQASWMVDRAIACFERGDKEFVVYAGPFPETHFLSKFESRRYMQTNGVLCAIHNIPNTSKNLNDLKLHRANINRILDRKS